MQDPDLYRRIDRNLRWAAAPVKFRGFGLLIFLAMPAAFLALALFLLFVKVLLTGGLP
jgi:hypothetical protein